MAFRFLFLVFGTLISTCPLLAGDLVSPIDVAAVRAANGTDIQPSTCKQPPPPLRNLGFPRFYKPDTNSSEVDHADERAYRDAYRPIGDFEKGIIRRSDRYVLSVPEMLEFAICVLNWLESWAKADAMLGDASQQGGYVRKWTLGTVSMAYLKIRDSYSLDIASKQRVIEWIGNWAAIVREDYSTGMHRSSRNNNHSYWAGRCVIGASIALHDRCNFDWE